MAPTLVDSLNALSEKIRAQGEAILTEEGTKNAFVMPFLQNALGYDVFDPDEVVPEFVADVGLKRGEKVDYAIKHDGTVQILIEVKKSSVPLDLEHAAQLYRYFSVTNARIGVLTNGQIYMFYTDLEQPNRMDTKPYMVLDLLNIDRAVVPELAKLSRGNFDLESVIGAAEELKYVGQIKRVIASQFADPSDEWVKYFTSRIYDGSFTQRVREQFKPLVLKASTQFLNDQTNSKLKSALGDASLTPSDVAEDPAPDKSDSEVSDDLPEVVTTEEELRGFEIVRAISCELVKPARIVYRDAKSYFAVLLDDNNRKTIVRLPLNAKTRKHLSLFDADGNEERVLIDQLEDIFDHAAAIKARVASLDGDLGH